MSISFLAAEQPYHLSNVGGNGYHFLCLGKADIKIRQINHVNEVTVEKVYTTDAVDPFED